MTTTRLLERIPRARNVLGLAIIAIAAALRVFDKTGWVTSIAITVLGLLMILWSRRIFHADVTRTGPEELLIRFAPWYEGFVWSVVLASPVCGVVGVVAAFHGGGGKNMIGTLILLAIAPFIPWGCIRLRRHCSLRITPSTLTVQSLGKTAINRQFTRDDIEAIKPFTLPQAPVDRRWVGLYYCSDIERKQKVRPIGGQQLTVQPDNLLHAMVAWKNPLLDESPVQLMDRIEATLRGRPGTGADHQHWVPNPWGDYGMGLIGAASILGDSSVAGISPMSDASPSGFR